jgi:hypothetical protein
MKANISGQLRSEMNPEHKKRTPGEPEALVQFMVELNGIEPSVS